MPTALRIGPYRFYFYSYDCGEPRHMHVDLEDGRTVSIPIGWFPRLAHGSSSERANLQISGAGYGLHWPDLDEDIGVEGLLLGKRSTESPESFEKWLKGESKVLSETGRVMSAACCFTA